jgi:pimeloyl-ACP methyl ester carboxylesterase
MTAGDRVAMPLLLIILMLCLGVARGAAAHPMGEPPGKMVDIGGRRMHLNCLGHGAPTVLIDIGLGAASLEWEPVMRLLAGTLKVCVIERAGYGWSEMGPYPRTSAAHVDELFLLQRAAELKPPFMLLGHSYGGFDMQLFARRYPTLVAGLVLVDASHPEQADRFAAPPHNVQIAPSSRMGLVHFGRRPGVVPGMTPAAEAQTRFQYENWRPRRTIAWELLGFRDSEAELRQAEPLKALPLVVLTRGKRVWPAGARGDQLEALWLSLQSELAAQSPTTAHLLALNSGHQIHLEQPAAVAYAVGLAVDVWRSQTTPSGAKGGYSGPWMAQSPGDLRYLSNRLGLPIAEPLRQETPR